MSKINHQTLFIGISLLITPFIVNANSTSTDPLEYFQNEIKQTQKGETQELADKLRADANMNNYSKETPPTSTIPLLEQSNAGKAFSSPAASPTSPPPTSDANKGQADNPWIKPNPWEAQSKVNPWANNPIPGPTPRAYSSPNNTDSAPNDKPNIFAPPPNKTSGSNTQ